MIGNSQYCRFFSIHRGAGLRGEHNTRIASLLDESTHDVKDPLVQIVWSRAEGRVENK